MWSGRMIPMEIMRYISSRVLLASQPSVEYSTLAEISEILLIHKIATYGNTTYVVWQDDTNGNNEVYLRISPAGTSDFSRIFNLSKNVGNSTDPQITTYGNTTYVVWQDDIDGNNEVYLKMSPAGKSAFGRIFNLSRNIGNSTESTNSYLWKYHLCGLAG